MPSIDHWVALASAASGERDRELVASPFAAEATRVERAEGPSARAAFVRGVLAALVERHKPSIASLRMPETVKRLVQREYARIEKNLVKGGDEGFDLARHTTRCDFRLVAFGRVPVGVEHIELGGVPRSLIWKGGASQGVRVASTLLRAGGHGPFYSAHLMHGIKPWAFLVAYNIDTLTAWHRTVAECLELNPEVRGLIASSWWYDPHLVRFAPHLAFLHEGSLAHGAILATAGETEGSRAFAVANSPERQQLVAAGTYRPASYSVIWTRRALLNWAKDGIAAAATTQPQGILR